MIRLAIERHTGVTGMQVLVMWVERNSLVARQVDALPEPDQMRDPADLLISQTDLIGRGPLSNTRIRCRQDVGNEMNPCQATPTPHLDRAISRLVH